MAPDIDDYAHLFAAAGHPLRLKILAELSGRGRRPSELAETLLVTPDAVRKHLRVLKDDGLVAKDDHGEYRVTPAATTIQRAAPSIFPPTFTPDDLE